MTDTELLEIIADVRAQQTVQTFLLGAALEKIGGLVLSPEQLRRMIMLVADDTENIMRQRLGLDPREAPREQRPNDNFEHIDWDKLSDQVF
jgi:hypothetical protein